MLNKITFGQTASSAGDFISYPGLDSSFHGVFSQIIFQHWQIMLVVLIKKKYLMHARMKNKECNLQEGGFHLYQVDVLNSDLILILLGDWCAARELEKIKKHTSTVYMKAIQWITVVCGKVLPLDFLSDVLFNKLIAGRTNHVSIYWS